MKIFYDETRKGVPLEYKFTQKLEQIKIITRNIKIS